MDVPACPSSGARTPCTPSCVLSQACVCRRGSSRLIRGALGAAPALAALLVGFLRPYCDRLLQARAAVAQMATGVVAMADAAYPASFMDVLGPRGLMETAHSPAGVLHSLPCERGRLLPSSVLLLPAGFFQSSTACIVQHVVAVRVPQFLIDHFSCNSASPHQCTHQSVAPLNPDVLTPACPPLQACTRRRRQPQSLS